MIPKRIVLWGAAIVANAAALLGLGGPAWACPGCQNPNLPVVRSGAAHLPPGTVQVGALLTAVPLSVQHGDGCADLGNCDQVPVQPRFVHDQGVLSTELRGTFDWAIREHLGLSLQVPVRVVHTSIQYTTPEGRPYSPPNADVHHRNETLVGIGDPLVMARLGGVFGAGWWWVLRGGVSLPLGRTEADPFKAGALGERHQHIQLGTGTFNPVVGGELARAFGALQVSAYGQVQSAVYANHHGYQAGLLSVLGLQGGWRFATRAVLHTSLEWMHQGAERWDGAVQQDGVLGRHEVLAGLGSTFSFGGPQYLVWLRAPLYRALILGSETEAGTLSAPITLTLGVQATL